MSDQDPYHEPFNLNDLPLPDGDAAWQNMKEKLDESDRRRRIVPPFFLSCALWNLGAIIILAASWFFLFRHADANNRETKKVAIDAKPVVTTPITKQVKENDRQQVSTSQQINNRQAINKENNRSGDTTTRQNKPMIDRPDASPAKPFGNSALSHAKQRPNATPNSGKRIIHNMPLLAGKENKKGNKRNSGEVVDRHESKNKPEVSSGHRESVSQQPPDNDMIAGNKVKATSTVTASSIRPVVDSSKQVSPMQPATDTMQTSPQPKKQKEQNWYALSVGLGEQQGVNIHGQATVPYNYYGRTSSLADYIPSVYVRLHRGEQWFLQGEFRYGAPQSVKEFSFSQQTKYDSATSSLVSTSTRIKKTFYHQIPVSFNYYILPHWSVGLGGMYSLFEGAITEKDITSKDVRTGLETNTKQIVRVPAYSDSFLYKTQWHFLLQTNYQWKRFTFGFRYQKDLQPFIKYTDPSGGIHTERNESFDLFIRFQLWRSKRFRF